MPAPALTWLARRLHTTLAVAVAVAAVAGCGAGGDSDTSVPAPDPAAGPTASIPSMEDEVRANILAQPVGSGTVADLALPAEFLDRLIDRVIRQSYQEHFHVFVGADPESDFVLRGPTSPAPLPRIVTHELAPAVAQLALAERRPGRRGFIAPGDETAPGVETVEVEAGEPAVATAARGVVEHLASDGLLTTLARLVEAAGPALVLEAPDDWLSRFHRAGLPIDLLDCFGRGGASGPVGVLTVVARIVTDEGSADAARARLVDVPFRWAPSVPGYRVLTESGEGDLRLLRLQLTRGTYWRGPGAGGSLDVARQLVAQLPGVDVVASVEGRHVEALLQTVATWPLSRPEQLTLISEPLPVSQWAQDSAKPGAVDDKIVQLAPRYASRREDGSVFIAGESALVDGLRAAGLDVHRSALLFQGGNLLAVRHPVSGERILLVGEAEIHRNVGLGLTADQAREAMRIEFGVDRVEVLPAVAFHIDYDLTVRAVDQRLVAFVNDPLAAARAIVLEGAAGLHEGELLDSDTLMRVRVLSGSDDDIGVVRAVGRPLMQVAALHGERYPAELAATLMVEAHESGIGNMRPLLCALDTLHAHGSPPPDEEREGMHYANGYLRAFHRLQAAREALHQRLRELGFDVVPVPGLPEGERGINYSNGVHDRTRYLMPAWGGRYAALDAQAQRAFEAVVGPDVEVVPILCAESQRRSGALHCSVSAVYSGQTD